MGDQQPNRPARPTGTGLRRRARHPHPLMAMRYRLAGALVAVLMLTAACASEQQPAPAEDGGYESTPELCALLGINDIAAQFDLAPTPWHEPSHHYSAGPSSWRASCRVSVWSEDGRFATDFEEFRPSGLVSTRVFHDPADAQDAYDNVERTFANWLTAHQGASTGPLDGWWDNGASFQSVHVLDPDDHDLTDPDAGRIIAIRAVHHRNLVIETSLTALSPTGDIEHALTLLHAFTGALTDTAVDHLPAGKGS